MVHNGRDVAKIEEPELAGGAELAQTAALRFARIQVRYLHIAEKEWRRREYRFGRIIGPIPYGIFRNEQHALYHVKVADPECDRALCKGFHLIDTPKDFLKRGYAARKGT
jgi:hypothetical protein